MKPDTAPSAAPVARTPGRERFQMLGGALDIIGIVEPPAGDVVLMRSRMEPGAMVPLHRHSDPECFLVLSGTIEVFADDGEGWRPIAAGSSITMENGIAHALRAPAGAELIIVTNHRLASFFRAAQAKGDDVDPNTPPNPEHVARVRQLTREFGYWMASAEEHFATTSDAGTR